MDEQRTNDVVIKWVIRVALVGVAFLVITSVIRLLLVALGAL